MCSAPVDTELEGKVKKGKYSTISRVNNKVKRNLQIMVTWPDGQVGYFRS